MHDKLRQMTGHAASCAETKDATIITITKSEKMLQHWMEQISNLFADNRGEKLTIRTGPNLL